MSKLTLSVDREVVERAKTYAQARRTSLSALVQSFFEELTRVSTEAGDIEPDAPLPPVTARLAGVLAGREVDVDAYRRHLERKYR